MRDISRIASILGLDLLARRPPEDTMLDVILYGYDRRGHLTLKERRFASLRELSAYISSPKGKRWRWAEINVSTDSGQPQVIHYTADALRGMVVEWSRNPSLN